MYQVKVNGVYGSVEVTDHPDDLISRSLRVLGEWAYCEVQAVSTVAREADVLYDVGAYLGTFSLGLHSIRPLRQVVAVEVNESVVPLLTRNLESLIGDRATVVRTGVARQDGWVVPTGTTDESNRGADSYRPSKTRRAGGLRALSLQSLRRRHGDYDILKLDIEGMESDALLGDADYILQAKPVIWAECNEAPTSFTLCDTIASLGYQPVYVAFPAFRRDNFNRSQELIYPAAYEAALVGLPADRKRRFLNSRLGTDFIIREVTSAADLRSALWNTPRWGEPEWLKMSKPELIARLGRITRGQNEQTFI